MPKKLGHNKSNRLNIASIVQRLPLHRHMSQSQSALIKLSPAWLNWSTTRLNADTAALISLTSLQNGLLTISCANAVTASQIKHQQADLLDSLTTKGFTNVKRIKVRIDHTANLGDPNKHDDTNNYANNSVTQSRQKPDSQTIKSIQHCQNQTSNDELSNSLKRLADTLNKLD